MFSNLSAQETHLTLSPNQLAVEAVCGCSIPSPEVCWYNEGKSEFEGLSDLDQKVLAERILEKRKARGLTQEQLERPRE